MELTEQQARQYQTFGLVILRHLLSPQEMVTLDREFKAAIDSWVPGGMNSGKSRLYVPLTGDAPPFLTGLLDDPRFCNVAEQLIGAPVLGQLMEGHYYVGDHIWHPVERAIGYKGIRFVIYPGLIHAQNGALRFLPGSQDDPLGAKMVRNTEEVFGLTADEVPSFVANTAPGDVIIHHPQVWRAALNAREYTRCIVLSYCEDPQTNAVRHAVVNAFNAYHQKFIAALGSGQMYPAYWRELANPRHQHWVRRISELGVLNTPQAK